MAIVFLFLVSDDQKMKAKARLHHDPVWVAMKVDIIHKVRYILTLSSCNGLVLISQMRHHGLQPTLPLIKVTWKGAKVQMKLIKVFVVQLVCVWMLHFTARKSISELTESWS